MRFNTPAIRLSLALTLLTLNLLFVANQIGLIVDESQLALELRKGLSESLAVQFAAAAAREEMPIIQTTLRDVVERNKNILSAVIRAENGDLLAMAGDHLSYWKPPADGKSTPDHINVPIYKNHKKWATVEISFAPLWTDHLVIGKGNSFLQLMGFMTLVGFIGTFLIIRWTLRELDPKAVIPERVQKAFDILQEGVVIFDQNEQIVMANKFFAALTGKRPESLLGLKGSELAWSDIHALKQEGQWPWCRVLEDGQEQVGALLALRNGQGEKIKLMVNATLVTDNAGHSRGALVTLDDVTQLEEKNFELKTMLEKLELANEEIFQKNQELESLANRDPLTLCFNRRAFSRQFNELFTPAKAEGIPLSCIMVDIDFFKSVNDRYGHATGDQVIKAVADVLKTSTRDSDLVGRYGGEEFCVVLPGISQDKAFEVAERIRITMENQSCSGVNVTLSLGVSMLSEQVNKPDELVNQADKALYAAKNSGRNRVICWGKDDDVSEETATPQKPQGRPEAKQQARPSAPADDAEPERLRQRVRELEGQLHKRALEIEQLSMFDASTGLPTRSLFEDRINREIVRGTRKDSLVAVLSMTVDTIKRIHETLGYNAAEQLVHACAHRLSGVLRENIDSVSLTYNLQDISTVSLVSSTEFGILLADIQQANHITWVVKRILDAFEQPFVIMDKELYPSVYIGISIFPHDGTTVDTLCSAAAGASRIAQELNGKERYFFCSQNTNDMAMNQLKIENQLHKAIANEELHLYYQPKILCKNGKIGGFEALLRWRSAELGNVPPDIFIPIAEQTGLIDDIGDWVIQTACRQLHTWRDAGMSVVPIAVNVSGVQLLQPDLVERICATLEIYRISSDLLEIELTESVLVKAGDRAFALLTRLRERGFRISMDDFGTGYSSLSYLKNLPLSNLKIDKSFVNDIGDNPHADQLIAAILSIAHSLGLEVIAEGVEQQHQADYLSGLQCEYLQGYHFSRPLPSEEATNILQQYNGPELVNR